MEGWYDRLLGIVLRHDSGDDEQNFQKYFTMGGILLELISEQFNVHAFQSSPCLGPMFTTYRELSGNIHRAKDKS